MKYKSLSKNAVKVKSLRFDAGINKEVEPDKIFENQLQDSLNIICKNNIVRSRKGILPKLETVIGNYDDTGSIKKDLTITDTEMFWDGVNNRIAYDVWGNNSYEKVNTYIVSPSGELTFLATISLNTAEGRFFNLENIFFIVGKKTFSSNVYAFVKRCCRYNGSNHYIFEIYEYDTDTDVFRKTDESDYYTPVIYINGRGADYEQAKKEGTVFTETPACPEELNLLGGRFSAYFTADGLSSHFKLPVSGLDFDYGVNCRIYSDTGSYTEWNIPADSYEATATYKGQTVKLNVDRLSGRFSFWNGNSHYSVPKTGVPNGNDICFTGTKELSKYKERIIGSKSVYTVGCEHYIFGNDVNKNEVYASKYDTPLYFPETMKTAIGNVTDKVITLKSLNNDLLAFKPDGVFKINSAGEAGKLSYISPIGTTRDFSKPTRLSNSAKTLSSGIKNENQLSLCGNNIIWFRNRKVFLFTGDEKTKEISKPIEKILDSFSDSEIENSFCSSFDGLFFLFFGNKVLVLNYEGDCFGYSEKFTGNRQQSGAAWFYFELPDVIRYVCAFGSEKQMFLVCSDALGKINYLCTFDGDKDIIIDESNPETIAESKNIPFSLTSKILDLEPLKTKSIVALNLQMAGNSVVSVDVSGDNYVSKQGVRLKSNNLSVIKVLPFFTPIDKMSLTIHGNAPFVLENTSIEYKIN